MKNNWIPCSKRLPEEVNGESKAVLAIVRHVDFDGLVYSENYQIVWRENRRMGMSWESHCLDAVA